MDQERLRLSQVALKVRRVMGLISAVLALLLASVAVYLAYRVFDQELTPWLLIEPGMMLVCSAFLVPLVRSFLDLGKSGKSDVC